MAEFFNLDYTAEEINEKLGKIPTDSTLADHIANELIDQDYNANSTKAQSGKAVAQAINTLAQQIPNAVTVDQEYDDNSSNAQSGKAVAQAISALSLPIVDQEFSATSSNAQSGKALNSVKEDLQGKIDGITGRLDNFTTKSFEASAVAPTNTAILWIDTNEDGGLKYYNEDEGEWVTVPVRFS